MGQASRLPLPSECRKQHRFNARERKTLPGSPAETAALQHVQRVHINFERDGGLFCGMNLFCRQDERLKLFDV